MESLLTTEDVAEYFRMDVVTIRRMIGKGELPAYRVGGEYRFKRGDIDKYLESQRVPAQTDAHTPLGKVTRRFHKLLTLESATNTLDAFTKRARNVLALAREEALGLNHTWIGTEHVLLGILRERQGIGAALLEEAGCTVDATRQFIRERVGPGPSGEAPEGELHLTPRVKKVLELAVDEARRLEHSYVGTEHLVLGLIREGEGLAGNVLRDRGLDLYSMRKRVQDMLTRIDKP